MAGIRKWKHGPGRNQTFRLPITICLGCILDEIWEQIPQEVQDQLIKKYEELATIGVSIHAPWCAKRKST